MFKYKCYIIPHFKIKFKKYLNLYYEGSSINTSLKIIIITNEKNKKD